MEGNRMLDLNTSVKWINDNAPNDVRNDVCNLLKAIRKYASNSINILNTIEDVEKDLTSPEKIQITINKFKKNFATFTSQLEKLNITEITIDDDIIEMINNAGKR